VLASKNVLCCLRDARIDLQHVVGVGNTCLSVIVSVPYCWDLARQKYVPGLLQYLRVDVQLTLMRCVFRFKLFQTIYACSCWEVQAARLVYIGNLEALAISWVFIKRQNIYSTQSHTQQEVEQQANPCKYRIYSQHTQHIQQGVLTVCNSSLPFNLQI